jgi:tRNA(adenine34) deaminase
VSWHDLSLPWQSAFEEAWAAYCAGSLPIGCVIADRDDHVLLRGRNRLHEDSPGDGVLFGNHLAHAEMNALAPLRRDAIDPFTCVLYTTMEPCPMCTGAIRMIKVGAVHYAARDPLAGSISLLETTPFMRRAGITVAGPAPPGIENFSVALNIAAFLKIYAGTDLPVRVMTLYQSILPDAVRLGQKLHDTGMLQRMRASRYNVDAVFDAVFSDPRAVD